MVRALIKRLNVDLRAQRTFEVLVRDLSGNATYRELSFRIEVVHLLF
jgi:hypothetical protein